MKKPYLWITLAVLAVYGQALFFKFTYLDDYTLLVQNAESFTRFANLFRIFTTDFLSPVTGGQYYRPLFAASLILNGALGGGSPFLFHLTDILLHLGVSLLLYRFLLNFTSEPRALFGGLVFAVHPLLVQTVAWIPGRTDSLAVLFILWYIIAFDRALKLPSERRHYLYAALAMAGALLSKETALLLPLISLLYAALISESEKKHKTLLRFVPIWIGLLALWFAGRSLLLETAAGWQIETIFSSMYLSAAAVVQYFGKMLLPFNLSTYPVMPDLRLTFGFLALAVVALGLLASKYKRYRVVIFGAAWFSIFLLVSLIRVKILPYDEVLEHRAYLALPGLLIIILEFDFFQKDWRLGAPRLAVAAGVLGLLAIINIAHAANFRNGLAYWKKAVATSPGSPFSHKQFGALLNASGDYQSAEEEYKKVITLNPEKTLVYNNLGFLYATLGRAKEAETMYRFEIAVSPDYDKSYMNLGNLYWQAGRADEAAALWQKTIALNPYFFPAYRNLAIYYYEKDRYAEGIKVLLEIRERGGQIDADLLESYRPYLPKSWDLL
ncbi:MAG: tetratricopeptide repeat protein [Candidatus Doudnabacteria bacterium]|nr:tetratricopeptide repeat protein [Candidatus Doudnabacteria bacterium]